jgi:guanylate kinase
MVKIKILYGSSCVGKSHIMNSMNESLFKIELDDCEYWNYPENERTIICINYFISKIKESIVNKEQNIIATCGHLPLPDDDVYNKIEKEFNFKIEHILIMNKNIDEYKKKIIKRQRQSVMNQLIKDYKWRESCKFKYDKIVIN